MPRSVHTSSYQTMLRLLLERRAKVGMSQRAVAKRLGKPHTYVHKVEVGDRQINVIELRAWCRALGIPWLTFAADLEVALAEQEQEAPIPSTEDDGKASPA